MNHKIISIITTYEKDGDFMGGVNECTIREAAQMLNIKFPNSYHWFLKQYGSGGLDGMDIHGCETTAADFSVVYHTKLYRETYNLPEQYIVLNDIDGTVTCLDTNQMKDGECPVVFLSRFSKELYAITYENFNDYLLDCLQESVDNLYDED
ncbi:SMI1-KNR4 cell-wall family protein [Bacillus cereus 03BB102]|uniref:Putative spore coat protein n=2 Tax=Bacillus cereus TaxID=1396 RepID=A0A158RTH4_BACC3|nr:SMI1/KNR4 family protein [Bacillus cereus]ACO30507.1 putative spore coat protein [Bacillus cereus 03BB102]AEW56324.1 spore coat protein, putative [Bacillus cereus F837/76]AJG54426.1 SMI1-KNR4 cell-wall family protein [Bacillus cereus 03BB102]PFM44044.1 SMI1/KNR4 family protein [Bacillus cereus]QPR84291.1 SMI1/KNR4 family protein [Bacillus cereus]